jgi:hypothetical protein
VDVYFLTDLIVQFFVAVRPLEALTTPNERPHRLREGYITDHRHIAWRYISSGWVRI